MKKLLLLLLIFPLVFISCSSDDENHNDNHEIESSAWSKDDSVFKNDILGLGVNGLGTYSYTTTVNPPKFHSYDLKWEYKKPNIMIKFKDGSNFGSGYIEGDKMYLKETAGLEVTYTKYR